jgi:hypothetical protein
MFPIITLGRTCAPFAGMDRPARESAPGLAIACTGLHRPAQPLCKSADFGAARSDFLIGNFKLKTLWDFWSVAPL